MSRGASRVRAASSLAIACVLGCADAADRHGDTGSSGGGGSDGASTTAATSETTSAGTTAGSTGAGSDESASTGGTGSTGGDDTGGGGSLHCGDVQHGRAPAPVEITWEQVLPVVAGNGLVADPAIPGTFYVFYETGELNASQQRVEKTTDFGDSWALVDETLINGNAWGVAIDPNPERCLDADPCPPPTLYRPAGYGFGNPDGSALGLWKSTDGGVLWHNLFKDYDDGVVPTPDGGTAMIPADTNGGHNDFYQAHILPDDRPNHVLVTYHYGSGQLLETKDGGDTWEVHSVPWGTSHYAFGFDADTWIVIPQEFDAPGAVYRTTTAGRQDGVITTAAWTQVDTSLHCHGGFTPWIDPTDCSLFIVGSEGVKRSSDRGASWEMVYPGHGCTISGSPDLLFISDLFKPDAVRLDLRESPPAAVPFQFEPDWSGITPFGTASAYDAANDRWVILATQYGGGVWRTVVP